jgi:lipopolysaccharide-induced tumor necrosis factor-alpha factor
MRADSGEIVIPEAELVVEEEQAPVVQQQVATVQASSVLQQVAPAPTPPQQSALLVYGCLGRDPCPIQCPYCHKMVMTRARAKADGMTCLFVVLLLVLFWPLFWLPLCLPSCKAIHHTCPECQQQVGQTDPCS